MNRRDFLRSSSALSLPLFATQVGANPTALFSRLVSPNSDRVLVLIQLTGGNDGLNTVIGLDQLDNLTAVRSNVAIPAAGTHLLNANTALHPSMSGMARLFTEGKLGIIQGTGYPNQDRSHFRSTDIWTRGDRDISATTTGWLGRYLELDHPDYPVDYPSAQFPYPFSMTMGNVVSETCQGTQSNFSQAVRDPFSYNYIAPGGNTPLPDNYYGSEVSYVRELIGQSNSYGEVVQAAAEAGNSMADYPDSGLAAQLRNIAYCISGGLGTKIYVATLGSFDTHSAQGILEGRHPELLRELSEAITAFQDDLGQLGLADRVLGMTFSEFGRRIRSNGSSGTDHGTAAPMFLFGECVAPQVLGNSPEIDTEVDQQAGVPMQYDFRDIYGSILVDWFEVAAVTVRGIFREGFTYLPIANGCRQAPGEEWYDTTVVDRDETIHVEWQTGGNLAGGGYEIERSLDGRNFKSIGRLSARSERGTQSYAFDDRDVAVGTVYYYRIRRRYPDGSDNISPVQTGRLRATALGEWTVGLPQPNPAGPRTYVPVYAPADGRVLTELFDINGRLVGSRDHTLAGRRDHRLFLRAPKLKAGLYTWRMTVAGGGQFTRKIMVSE